MCYYEHALGMLTQTMQDSYVSFISLLDKKNYTIILSAINCY